MDLEVWNNLTGNIKARSSDVSPATAKLELLTLWAITAAGSGEVG